MRPIPAPATTPTPREIISVSSSRIDEALIAVSRVIIRRWCRVTSDWFMVCMPSFSWPACIAE